MDAMVAANKICLFLFFFWNFSLRLHSDLNAIAPSYRWYRYRISIKTPESVSASIGIEFLQNYRYLNFNCMYCSPPHQILSIKRSSGQPYFSNSRLHPLWQNERKKLRTKIFSVIFLCHLSPIFSITSGKSALAIS